MKILKNLVIHSTKNVLYRSMSDAASKPKIGVVGMGHVGKKNKLSFDFRTLGKD